MASTARTEIQRAEGRELAELRHAPASFSTEYRGLLDHYAHHLASRAMNANDEGVQRKIGAEIEEKARDLAGPAPSASVAMLAQSAAMAWAALRYAEVHLWEAEARGGVSFKSLAQYQRAVERASSRWLKTLRTLAQVRRLESRLPSIQVNLGGVVNVKDG